MLLPRSIVLPAPQKRRKGFTLTEAAIVLGIVGLVLGAIWVAAGAVSSNNKTRMTVQDLQAIAHNIRDIFAEQGGVTDSGSGALTRALDQLKAFPFDMRQDAGTSSGILFHPWSTQSNNGLGSVYIDADNCIGTANTASAPQPCFGVTFYSVPQSACITLLTQTSESGTGLKQIQVNGDTAGTAGGLPPLPVPASTAQGACGVSNTVLWIYSVRSNGS